MRASTEVQVPENSINVAGPKSFSVVQAPGKGSQEEILDTLRVMLWDIDGNEVSKLHSSGCSTHSVRLPEPFNDRLLGDKVDRM